MSSNRARYFHMMNRVRQAKEKGQTSEPASSPKPVNPAQKSISNYFLPKAKTVTAAEGVSNSANSSPKPESSTKKKTTCERTIRALNSFAAKSDDKEGVPGSGNENSLEPNTSENQVPHAQKLTK